MDREFTEWATELSSEKAVAIRVSELSEEQRAVLTDRNIRSVFVIPIRVDGSRWGFLGLDDCLRERAWSDAERDSLLAAADMLGAAIDRQRAHDALLEAKATLEQRVKERTEALQQENLERRGAESALARSLSVIHATLESTLDGILVIDRDGRVKHFNRRFSEMWGITPELLTASRNKKILAVAASQVKDHKSFIKGSLKLHADPTKEGFDVVELKDGRIFERYTRPQQADNVSAGRVWSFRDITERKRAEGEIRYERDLLQALLDSLPDALFFKDLDSRFVRVSRSRVESSLARLRARHDADWAPGEIQPYPAHLRSVEAMRQWLGGKSESEVFPEDSATPWFEEEREIIRSGQPVEGRIESTTLPSGQTEWHLITKMPWRDERGTIIGTYGICKNITPIKEAEAKLKAVHEELLRASRLAGMAEVATGVLHNVGNVLNSVNVSASLVREQLRTSEIGTLARLAGLIRSRRDDLGAFLTTDPKGKLIPEFVIQLADHLGKEHAVLDAEQEQLSRNVEHIKEIVAMQQTYARVSGVLEKAHAVDVLEDALQINASGLLRHSVKVVREFADVPPITLDKHKVMQILVNLIHNAKYALDESDSTNRRITIGIGRTVSNRIKIFVTDNGIGIPKENLTRVFSHGFTTRRNGHGFGLHSGANAAREMGGLLRAQSDGPGLGATFTLELPLDSGDTNHD
jgi:PAS domain S-box-containing protein